MSVPFIILTVVFAAVCLALISAILLQKKRDAGGVGSIAGMGNVAETYWDRNKGRSMEGSLEKWTKVGGVVIAILAIVLCLV
ncbi:MAG: preprotein translocase subunit SecG [Defluviitaleaceae bacterium]|nr:preprotein translocase subunit SecG [Defluviitaleaceae bacterium]